jgi:hypothetical protein
MILNLFRSVTTAPFAAGGGVVGNQRLLGSLLGS